MYNRHNRIESRAGYRPAPAEWAEEGKTGFDGMTYE